MQAEVHYPQLRSHNAEDDKDRPWVPQEGIEWLQIIGRGTADTHPDRVSAEDPFQQDLERRVGSWGIKDADTRCAILNNS
jgi:hypothetical protein